MPETALTLLAVKAKTVALVAGTAVLTAGAVGGGTVALQSVSSDSPIAANWAATAAATPTATIGIGKRGRGNGAERRSDTATAVLTGERAAPAVTFTCDPSRNHGQNVSAYVHSLPKGPGRGQLVSQAAQSNCGKDAEAETTEELEPAQPAPASKPAKADKPAKAAKANKAAKPAKPAKAAKAETPDLDDDAADGADEAERRDGADGPGAADGDRNRRPGAPGEDRTEKGEPSKR